MKKVEHFVGLPILFHRNCRALCDNNLQFCSEMALRQPYGLSTDIWAMGVILYFMLVGKYPFGGTKDKAAVMENIRRGSFTLPSFISEEARDLVMHLLTRVSIAEYLSFDMP